MLNSRIATQVAQVLGFSLLLTASAVAQIGTRFPSEKKIIPDPVTGVPLTFLTSTPAGDSKIYQTHHQWTSDGKWVIFRSNRVRGQAMAVNEETGDIVQVTGERLHQGCSVLAEHSMNLYFARITNLPPVDAQQQHALTARQLRSAMRPPRWPRGRPKSRRASPQAPRRVHAGGRGSSPVPRPSGPAEIGHARGSWENYLPIAPPGKSARRRTTSMSAASFLPEMGAVGDVALDPTEDFVYFRVGPSKEYAAQHLAPDA